MVTAVTILVEGKGIDPRAVARSLAATGAHVKATEASHGLHRDAFQWRLTFRDGDRLADALLDLAAAQPTRATVKLRAGAGWLPVSRTDRAQVVRTLQQAEGAADLT